MEETENFDDLMHSVDNGFNNYGGDINRNSDNIPSEQNLIEFQLDFTRTLEDIKLYLSGYTQGYDKDGNWSDLPPESDEQVPFNSFGVNVIMGHLRAYLNSNTVLSNYTEKRIKKICFDLGNFLGDEIEQTYEKLGMDTDYKQRRFKLIIIEIMCMVESAFLRAMGGGERESLRKTMNISQSGGLNGQSNQGIKTTGGFKLTKPKTWLK